MLFLSAVRSQNTTIVHHPGHPLPMPMIPPLLIPRLLLILGQLQRRALQHRCHRPQHELINVAHPVALRIVLGLNFLLLDRSSCPVAREVEESNGLATRRGALVRRALARARGTRPGLLGLGEVRVVLLDFFLRGARGDDVLGVFGLLESLGSRTSVGLFDAAEYEIHGGVGGFIVLAHEATGDVLDRDLAGVLEVLRRELALLDDDVVEHLFLGGLAQDVGFDGVLADQPVDMDVTGLPDAVASVLALLVHSGIPVLVVKDDRIGTREVETETA